MSSDRRSLSDLSLASLGFTPFEARQTTHLPASTRLGRVTRVEGSTIHVLTVDGPERASARGGACVVGDWVVLDQPHVTPLERRTQIQRASAGTARRQQVVAANVDRVFVVMGLDNDFSVRRLERYLVLCADAGVEVVVLLTKAASCPTVDAHVEACQRVIPPTLLAAVFAIDVIDGVAIEIPASHCGAGVTVALLGSSGAGKSTLVNHLLGAKHMATSAVRAGDQRGRHTTTHRELVLIPSGGLLIDNPGMRELALWIDDRGLERAFSDVEALAAACRFGDCGHHDEPGCAVREAVRSGDLDEDRLASYGRLHHEAEALDRLRDTRLRRDHERRQSKLYRRTQRENRKRRGG